MIVVTAASGRLGRAVAAELRKHLRPSEVRLAARSPAKIADLAARDGGGFSTERADYTDRASLDQAFAGAERVLLISGVSANEQRKQEHRTAIDAAKAAGVRRIVYTSYANPTPASLFPFAAIHGDTESYLKDSGLAYTILRNRPYAANLDGSLAQSKTNDLLSSPAAEAKVAYITHADAAAAAVGALLGEQHEGKTYEITGPEAVTLHDVGTVLAAIRGRKVTVAKSALADLHAYYQSLKLPPFLVEALVGASAATAAGEYANVTGDAALLAGRPTMSMREYVKRFA
jgi:NAD(P)H dehydrogenase (quinone)